MPFLTAILQDRISFFVISLGQNDLSGVTENRAPAAVPTARPARPANAPASTGFSGKAASGGTPKAASGLSAKIAGVTKDSVVVEMADRKEPKRTYRLVIDFDYDALQVKQATLSDFRGNLKRFDVIANEDPPIMAAGGLSSSAGPRKSPENSAAQPERRTPFKWGAQTKAPAEPAQPKVISRGPLRVEQFALQASPSAR